MSATEKLIRTICLDNLSQKLSGQTLFIIGNGFDLMHRVKSSYYHFRDSIGKRSIVSETMESYIRKPDLWGDFENNLAYLDRAMMMGMLDDWLEDFGVLEQDDENFSAADFFAALDTATQAIDVLTYQLPKRFRLWINSLTVDASYAPLGPILQKGSQFITFNYTEFLETIYGIPASKILYIHGDRRDKKQKLVLGHGRDEEEVFNEWRQANLNRREYQPIRYGRKGRPYRNDNPVYLAYFLQDDRKGNWKNQTRYDAITHTRRLIEEYYSDSAKKTQNTIALNRAIFESLGSIKDIVVIGHSLSDVDHPYFHEIRRYVSNNQWYISYYDERSLQGIRAFVGEMGIPRNQVSIFPVS